MQAKESLDTLEYVQRILKEERQLEFAATPLQTSRFQVRRDEDPGRAGRTIQVCEAKVQAGWNDPGIFFSY
ncbi:hypothetical protein E6C60_4119 [Paenibacillus algicola]|uniref:Uncharacterized protein n=1 Tax=Paenibacillus algicola TaxID=2565926 RepID=A0A4V1G4I6_9BACL|nr:hypothetical protein E6C60_4119 [Paenibacillus algicola]